MQNRTLVSRSWRGGLTPFFLVVSIAAAMLAGVALTLLSPYTAHADHDSMTVVCPDPISEGNTGQMRVTFPGRKDFSLSVFTYHGDYTAGADDFTGYHGTRMESQEDEDTVRVPIVTTEDTLAEHDETFSIGFWEHGEWQGCLVAIDDDDAPRINFVELSSRPADGSLYRTGESIDVTVNLDANVDVDGTPQLSLYVGNTESEAWRSARYSSGSGSRSLVFRYTVQPEDFDDDGVKVGSAGTSDDGSPAYGFTGNIYAAGTDVPIEYGHSGTEADGGQKVDGRPYVQKAWVSSSPPAGWSAYRTNQVIEVSFTYDIAVVVEGDVSAGIYLGYDHSNWDEAVRRADYLRGSGSDTLVFGYTVRPGDMDSKGIMISLGTQGNGFGGNGSVKARGTDVEQNPYYPDTGRQPGQKVDTAPPAITSVSITSQPANGESYAAGEAISVEVLFSEEIEFHVDMHLELDVSGTSRQAVFDSVLKRGSSNVLVFQYVVQGGDTDADGIGIRANSLRPNEGGIHDGAGNAADLSFPALSADPDHRVAASPAS